MELGNSNLGNDFPTAEDNHLSSELRAVKNSSPIDRFSEILNQLVASRICNDMDLFLTISAKYREVLKEARNNNLYRARAALHEASIMKSGHPAHTLLYRLVDVSALPAEAYLLYKQGDYTGAEQLLMKSINDSFTLVEEGFFILEFHRIQQLHNLARIAYRLKHIEQGGHIINQALSYMLCHKEPLVGGKWSTRDMNASPASLKEDMIVQLALESVAELLPPLPRGQLFHEITFKDLLRDDKEATCSAVLKEWLMIKEYPLRENDELFVETAVNFIRKNHRRFDILKLSLIMDIADVMQKEGVYDRDACHYLADAVGRLLVSDRHKSACLIYLEQYTIGLVEPGSPVQI